MAKRKISQASWYRVEVRHTSWPAEESLVWDILASNIDLAKQAAVSELGDGYEVASAIYKGTKAAYHRRFDPMKVFEPTDEGV